MIPADKILHFSVGLNIALIIGLFNPLLGLIASVIAGIGKEFIWDKWLKKGNFEWWDLVATCLGGFMAYLITLI